MRTYLILLWIILTCPLIGKEEINYKFVYHEHSQHPSLKLSYAGDLLIERCFYHYNDKNECELIIIDNGHSEDPQSLEGATGRLFISLSMTDENHIQMRQTYVNLSTGEEKLLKEVFLSCEHDLVKELILDDSGNSLEVLYDPDHTEFSILESPVDGLKKLTTFFYDENDNLLSIFTQSENGSLELETRDSAEMESSFLKRMSDSFYQLFHHAYNGTAYVDKLKDNFESILKFLVRPGVFRISGYHTHPARVGVHGTGEVSDKVRVTLINGILNYPTDQTKHLEMFSKFHGGVNIHHVLRPCEGWSVDMFRCAATKLGIISKEARMLAAKWKELIEEMGGVDKGGVIIHYAHSIGGTETDNAKRLMSPEELKMIRVYALASPTIIHSDGFQHAMNYVSLRDGVCYLDPIDYFGGMIFSNPNIVYLDTLMGTPIVDHLITSPSYKQVIQRLGDEFVQTYGAVNVEKVD